MIDDLLAQLQIARSTWVLILTGVTSLAFALSAFACDQLGRTIISPFLAATATAWSRLKPQPHHQASARSRSRLEP